MAAIDNVPRRTQSLPIPSISSEQQVPVKVVVASASKRKKGKSVDLSTIGLILEEERPSIALEDDRRCEPRRKFMSWSSVAFAVIGTICNRSSKCWMSAKSG